MRRRLLLDRGAGLEPVLLRSRVTLVEQRDSSFDALQRLDALAFELDQDAGCVLVCTAPDLFGLAVSLGHDLLAALLGRARQLALLDQERRLLLGARDDPVGLLLGVLQ